MVSPGRKRRQHSHLFHSVVVLEGRQTEVGAMVSFVRRTGQRSAAGRARPLWVSLVLLASAMVALARPAAAIGPNAIVTDAGCSSSQPPVNAAVNLPFPVAFYSTTYTSA